MLDNSSGSNGSGTGGTGRRRSTFYVTLSENMTANGGTNNSENRESLDKTSNTKMSPQKKLSNSSQTLTVEPEKNSVSRRTTPKSSSQTHPSKSPSKSSHVSMKTGTKPSPVHVPQPFKACTRTVQGPQLLRLPPPQSPKTPKKSSSLLQLSSIKSPESSSSSAQKTGGKPLQLSLSLRRTPSTRTTVVVTPRDGAKSSVRKVSLNTKTASTVSSKAPSKDGHKQIPLVVVDQHDSSSDVKTSDTQEGKQPSRHVSKDGGEEDINDAGVHSGKSVSMLR